MPMNDHADIVENHWSSGTQTLAARLVVSDGGVLVRGSEESKWSSLFLRPLRDPASGDMIQPSKDPQRFLAALHVVQGGSAVTVTDVHDDMSCPFLNSDSLPMRRIYPRA